MNVVRLEDQRENLNHMRSIKCGCLAHFSTKRFSLVEISQKCNHSIYICDLQSFVIRFENICNYKTKFQLFGYSHNYDATIRNFILLVGLILHLFSSINRLMCPISRNSHHCSYILKVLYIRVYFNVCTKIIYIICICMYIVHITNLKINI